MGTLVNDQLDFFISHIEEIANVPDDQAKIDDKTLNFVAKAVPVKKLDELKEPKEYPNSIISKIFFKKME